MSSWPGYLEGMVRQDEYDPMEAQKTLILRLKNTRMDFINNDFLPIFAALIQEGH